MWCENYETDNELFIGYTQRTHIWLGRSPAKVHPVFSMLKKLETSFLRSEFYFEIIDVSLCSAFKGFKDLKGLIKVLKTYTLLVPIQRNLEFRIFIFSSKTRIVREID